MVSNTSKYIEYYLNNTDIKFPITISQLMKGINIYNYPYIYRLLKNLESENKLILAKKGKTLLIIK